MRLIALTLSLFCVRSERNDFSRWLLSFATMSSSDWSGTIRMEMAAEAELGMSDFCAGPGTSTLWTESAGCRQLEEDGRASQLSGRAEVVEECERTG